MNYDIEDPFANDELAMNETVARMMERLSLKVFLSFEDKSILRDVLIRTYIQGMFNISTVVSTTARELANRRIREATKDIKYAPWGE